MKQVEVQIEKRGRRPSEDAPREKQAVPVGSVAWWEEMLLICFVFPSYCHFLCSWSRVERERETSEVIRNLNSGPAGWVFPTADTFVRKHIV